MCAIKQTIHLRICPFPDLQDTFLPILVVAQSRTFSTLTMENFWKWLLNQFVSTLLGKLFMALPEKPQPGCSTQAPQKLKCWGHLRDSKRELTLLLRSPDILQLNQPILHQVSLPRSCFLSICLIVQLKHSPEKDKYSEEITDIMGSDHGQTKVSGRVYLKYPW